MRELPEFLKQLAADENRIYRAWLRLTEPKESTNIFNYVTITEDEFILELIDFVMAYQMSLGDALHYGHWGVVVRDGKECAVLMDYGLNAQDFKYYYDSGRVKKQFRHGRL